MLFATRNIMSPSGRIVAPNERIKEDEFGPDLVKQLLAKGSAVDIDPATVTEPAETPSGDKKGLAQGAWAFDPATIAADSLDVLNMKIAGHVQRFGLAAVEPFADAEEARAFMSLEWQNG